MTYESVAEIEGGWPQCSLAENEANAELIVRAVNSYDSNQQTIKALCEALERIAAYSGMTLLDPDEIDDQCYGRGANRAFEDAAAVAREALAMVEGKE